MFQTRRQLAIKLAKALIEIVAMEDVIAAQKALVTHQERVIEIYDFENRKPCPACGSYRQPLRLPPLGPPAY